MIEEPDIKTIKNPISFKVVNLIYLGMALFIPPIVCYFIVLFTTSSIGVISRQLWTLPIIWPEALYIGGIIGGFLGGLIGVWEISMFHRRKRQVTPGKILSPDLYYIITLIGFTYILQFISDSQVPQGILFSLEVGFFIIIGWNLSKILLETDTKELDQQVSNTNQEEKPEIEKYMSE
ncbi:MAG: hypothetical protein ACXAC6_05185 [Candidatus Hodarchaeales archaeon]